MMVMLFAGVVAIHWEPIPLIWSVSISILLLSAFLFLIRFHWEEVLVLLTEDISVRLARIS